MTKTDSLATQDIGCFEVFWSDENEIEMHMIYHWVTHRLSHTQVCGQVLATVRGCSRRDTIFVSRHWLDGVLWETRQRWQRWQMCFCSLGSNFVLEKCNQLLCLAMLQMIDGNRRSEGRPATRQGSLSGVLHAAVFWSSQSCLHYSIDFETYSTSDSRDSPYKQHLRSFALPQKLTSTSMGDDQTFQWEFMSNTSLCRIVRDRQSRTALAAMRVGWTNLFNGLLADWGDTTVVGGAVHHQSSHHSSSLLAFFLHPNTYLCIPPFCSAVSIVFLLYYSRSWVKERSRSNRELVNEANSLWMWERMQTWSKAFQRANELQE